MFNVRSLHAIVLMVMSLLITTSPAVAAEYFVSLNGSDDNAGSSLDTSFATIQKGVDALQPGDTLTIAPGEYFEAVYRADLGSSEADTTIRAMIPRTVTLRGDRPINGFEKTEGYRFVYGVSFEDTVEGVLERSTPQNLKPGISLAQLDSEPGMWWYNEQEKMLYVSSSDLMSAQQHQYSVGLTARNGLFIQKSHRLVIDGLVATGFQNAQMLKHEPGSFTAWGIILTGAHNAVIRNCTAYLNGGGIAVRDSGADGKGYNNTIEYCTAFANNTVHSVEVGNIIYFAANTGYVRNNYFYGSAGNGMRFYGAATQGTTIASHNIGWGNAHTDYFLKGGKVGLVENSIALGQLHSKNIKNSIIGTFNQYNREPTNDTFSLNEAVEPDQRQFADPANLDFHLQATSTMIGSGPDGSDRGPFPYKANNFFVHNNGSDSADGLSVTNAWKTLDHAITQLRPGDTLYLVEGTYDITHTATLKGDAQNPIAIKGRGVGNIIINGSFNLTRSSHVTLERLHFTSTLSLADSSNITLRNNYFYNSKTGVNASDVTRLRLTHNVFTGFGAAAVNASKTTGLHLDGNLFDNAQAAAVAIDNDSSVTYADYNAYHQSKKAWQIKGESRSLKELQPVHERYASVIVPQFTSGRQDLPVLNNTDAFASGGPRGESLGTFHEYRPREIKLVGPVVHSMTATTANIEWATSVPTLVELAWGTTPACENTAAIESYEAGGYSLIGLTPGKTYYFKIKSLSPAGNNDKQLMATRVMDAKPLSFTLPTEAHKPVVYYVAQDGNDANDGKSREQAWRTVAKAGRIVLAGDTVLIGEGEYKEVVDVRGSGDENQPVTFKTIPGEKVTFDGVRRLLRSAFNVNRKHYIHLDGMYFQNFGLKGWDTILNFYDSSHLTITRCFHNGRGYGNPPSFMNFERCHHITLTNNVFANGMYGASIRFGVSHLLVEHNVFMRSLITNFNIAAPGETDTVVMRHNIFTDSSPYKSADPANIHLFELGGKIPEVGAYVFEDNVFYLRKKDEVRKPFFFYGAGPGRMSVADYEKRTGHSGNVVANPGFAIIPDKAPVDRFGKEYPWIGDWVCWRDDLDFLGLYITDSALIERGMGLQPEAFKDFHFNHKTTEATQAAAASGK